MNQHRPAEADQSINLRAKTTNNIWAMVIPIMAISIPLTAITNTGGLIPLTVLAAAAFSTAAVWMRGGNSTGRASAHEIALQAQVRELEERLASLEEITNFEHRLLEAKYPNAAPISPESGSSSQSSAPSPIMSASQSG